MFEEDIHQRLEKGRCVLLIDSACDAVQLSDAFANTRAGIFTVYCQYCRMLQGFSMMDEPESVR
jgi:hypothetical protein